MAAPAHFSKDTLAFLDGLKANNHRDWFTANKATYEAAVKHPAAAVAEAMAAALEDLTGHAQDAKVFRIHRDVRFSKDKTPYNAHVHIAFTPRTGADSPPMWFFGLDTERLTIGCGVFAYEKAALERFREDMAGDRGAEITALLGDLGKQGFRIGEPALKTVPRGYDRDHPNAEALRRKGVTAWMDLTDRRIATHPDLIERCGAIYRDLLPLYRFLSGE